MPPQTPKSNWREREATQTVLPRIGHHHARYGGGCERGYLCQSEFLLILLFSIYVVFAVDFISIGQHYLSLMLLLLNILCDANGADYRKLRMKTMERAGLIGCSYDDLCTYLHA
jgi:hypothetical protein